MDDKLIMEKDSNKSIGEKLVFLTGFIKNAKFLILTIIVLVVIGLAVISGDGKNIVLDFYENITGQKFQTFSPIQDYSNETYLILKAKLSQDSGISLDNMDITIFEESNALHKYRVEFKGDVSFYKVEIKQNGIWQINKE